MSSCVITADTPATVWKVLAGEGDTVSDGDTLMILEAMKMEIPVEAEQDGVVARILVAEGDLVEMDQRLVELV
ncbi:biotin/lipoyl-binding carrier protein [Streptomyces antnestii]|uniref:Biotin/lipoyl-binding carrier protein n=1 Tax=Streptomyces antnestii TaxID=2494256 RepID=A0A3S2W1H6_9ACTN|nr:biotin/lipoyl-binding carrier protein [Streptomyces sp. San01]RVU29021.1 biotin/lipoyl-binding carrier protein [Streptomyces sp. San01]